MEKISTKLKIWITVALIPLCLVSCASRRNIPDYRDSSFSCNVEFFSGGIHTKAQVRVEQGADGQSEYVVAEFTYPPTLSGIILSRYDGSLTAEYGGKKFSAEAMSELFSYAELLIPQGSLSYVCKTELDGKEVTFAEIKDTEDNGNNYELYLDKDTSAPIKIRDDGKEIRIVSFSTLE